MNEFIVWDKTEVGKKPRLVEFTSYVIKGNWIYLEYEDKKFCKEALRAHLDDVEICYDIGKTDIDGNKIYADSSIVEFDTRLNSRQKGFFTYSKMFLGYVIEDLSDNMRYARYDGSQINLKVIGNLQENPELLK